MRSDVAKLARLHSVENLEHGVVGMRHLQVGLVIPAGGTAVLKRGGTHVMFMGLVSGFEQGQVISATLVFENAGEIEVDIAVDLLSNPGEAGPKTDGMDMDGMAVGNTAGPEMGAHQDGTNPPGEPQENAGQRMSQAGCGIDQFCRLSPVLSALLRAC